MAKNNKGSGQASIFETSRNPPKVKKKSDEEMFALGYQYRQEKRGWQTVMVLKSPKKLKAS